jgi:hypothetical protein
VPGTEIFGALVNLQNSNAETQVKDLQNAARGGVFLPGRPAPAGDYDPDAREVTAVTAALA